MGEIAARDIDSSPGGSNHRIAGRDGNRSTARTELGDVAFGDIGKTGQVTERCADPAASSVAARAAEIDQEGFAAKTAGALEGGVGEFGAAKLDGEEIIRERHKGIHRSTGIDQCARGDIHLPPGKEEALAAIADLLRGLCRVGDNAVVVGVHKRPDSRADADSTRGRNEGRASRKVDSQALDVHLGRLGELGAWDFFIG